MMQKKESRRSSAKSKSNEPSSPRRLSQVDVEPAPTSFKEFLLQKLGKPELAKPKILDVLFALTDFSVQRIEPLSEGFRIEANILQNQARSLSYHERRDYIRRVFHAKNTLLHFTELLRKKKDFLCCLPDTFAVVRQRVKNMSELLDLA